MTRKIVQKYVFQRGHTIPTFFGTYIDYYIFYSTHNIGREIELDYDIEV